MRSTFNFEATVLIFIITTLYSNSRATKIRLVTWVNNEPYYTTTHDGQFTEIFEHRGIVPYMLAKDIIGDDCSTSTKEEIIDEERYHLSTHDELVDLITAPSIQYVLNKLNMTLAKDEILLISASSYPDIGLIAPFYERKTIMKVKPVIITYSGYLLLLIKFLHGLPKCMIVIYFATTVAVLVAAIIWLIECSSRNQNFPKTFGKGLWTSFWFCFVTMATVGYGDKVPKNFLTRIISILWMVFSMTLVAMTTASVMESIDTVIDRKNQPIAVLKNSSEKTIVRHQLHAIPVEKDSYDDIIQAIHMGEVESGLIDQNVAAVIFHRHGEQMKYMRMERELNFNTKIRVFAYRHDDNATSAECRKWSTQSEVYEDLMDDIQVEFIPPKQISKYNVRSVEETYDDSDFGLIKYTSISALVLIIIAFLSEFYVYILPTIQRNKRHNNADIDLLCDFQATDEYKHILETKKAFQNIVDNMVTRAVNRFHETSSAKLLNNSNVDVGVSNIDLEIEL